MYLSHGDDVVKAFVLTILATCLAILLYVNVGSSSSMSLILPKGNNPVLTKAWKPLHIPRIKPSFSSSKYSTASLTFVFLSTLAINLPDPSGSSDNEKPPGINKIWLYLIFFAKSSIDLSM